MFILCIKSFNFDRVFYYRINKKIILIIRVWFQCESEMYFYFASGNGINPVQSRKLSLYSKTVI